MPQLHQSLLGSNILFISEDIGKIVYWPDGTTDSIIFVENSGSTAILNSFSNKGTANSPVYNIYSKTNEYPLKKYSIDSVRTFCDYIYLDTEERRTFAQMEHNYLITQLQFNGNKTYIEGQKSEKIEIDFC